MSKTMQMNGAKPAGPAKPATNVVNMKPKKSAPKQEPEADEPEEKSAINMSALKNQAASDDDVPAPAKPKAAPKAKPSSEVKAAKFSTTYEFEHEGKMYPFTKRRALALKAYIDTNGEADPKVVAADMEKEFGPAKKGTHLASARRILGTYKMLKEAGVLK